MSSTRIATPSARRTGVRGVRQLFIPLLCAAAMAGCDDAPTAPGSAGPPTVPMATPVKLAAVTCLADVREASVRCGPTPPGTGASTDILMGGQGKNVQITSSNIVVTDVADAAAQDTFAFQVTVQNLIPQTLGTSNGVTADAGGVRVFFDEGPVATEGTGGVDVANADGVDAFTASSQPYFRYAQMLATGATSSAKVWKLVYDPGVTHFSFRVFVAAAVQYPDGWVDVSQSGMTVAPGGSGQLAATVRTATGAVVDAETPAWSSTVPGVATVDAAGMVSAVCGGTTVVSASTATRPARTTALVTVPVPFTGFSPDAYAGEGSTVNVGAPLTASFAGCVSPAAGTLSVRGAQSGGLRLGGSVSAGGSTVSYAHALPFFAGEEVEMTLTSALSGAARAARFRMATGIASGNVSRARLYPSGAGTLQALAAGDLNGDGRTDLVVAGSSPDGLRVMLRRGDNAGYDTASYDVGVIPYDVAVGDLNGDGRMDLAVADARWLTVKLLYRNAANTGYGTPVSYAMPNGAARVALADLNGDGRLDLVMTGSSVVVRLQNGTGGFDAPASYTAGSNPKAVSVGDVSGDGVPDVVVANYGSSSISVLAGDGTGALAAAVTYGTGSNPSDLAVADLNGDGRADLAVALDFGNTVTVFNGDGAGGFAPPAVVSVGAVYAHVVRAADLNGDGRLDLVTANSSDGSITVLQRNSGNTGYDAPRSYVAGHTPQALVVGDMDGDGRMDVAVGILAGDVGVMLRNAGNTGYDDAVSYSMAYRPGAVAAGDLDGDGRLDLVVVRSSPANLAVLLRDASGTAFAAPVTYSAGSIPQAVAIGDLNGDGRLDLATSDGTNNRVTVLYRNTGNTGYTSTGPLAIGAGGSGAFVVTSIAVGDLNGDGRADIAVSNSTTSNVSVLYRKANNGGFEAAVNYSVGTGPVLVAIGDLNGDGLMDLALASRYGNSLNVMLRNAANTDFGAPLSYAAGANVNALAVGDLNGDGRTDVALATPGQTQVFMRNAGNSGFNAAVGYGPTGQASVAIGDMNGDGRLDLVTGRTNDNAVTILYRNAANNGYGIVGFPLGYGSQFVALGDLNGDGRLDVAVVSQTTTGTVMEMDNTAP